jgi:hypothetical protein
MDLVEVDVWRVEAGEGRVDLVEDRTAREPGLIHVVAGVAEAGLSAPARSGRRERARSIL